MSKNKKNKHNLIDLCRPTLGTISVFLHSTFGRAPFISIVCLKHKDYRLTILSGIFSTSPTNVSDPIISKITVPFGNFLTRMAMLLWTDAGSCHDNRALRAEKITNYRNVFTCEVSSSHKTTQWIMCRSSTTRFCTINKDRYRMMFRPRSHHQRQFFHGNYQGSNCLHTDNSMQCNFWVLSWKSSQWSQQRPKNQLKYVKSFDTIRVQ